LIKATQADKTPGGKDSRKSYKGLPGVGTREGGMGEKK